jgi:hypothetical protein
MLGLGLHGPVWHPSVASFDATEHGWVPPKQRNESVSSVLAKGTASARPRAAIQIPERDAEPQYSVYVTATGLLDLFCQPAHCHPAAARKRADKVVVAALSQMRVEGGTIVGLELNDIPSHRHLDCSPSSIGTVQALQSTHELRRVLR